ncbi:unnamed protein product [Alopecurus aequalis]
MAARTRRRDSSLWSASYLLSSCHRRKISYSYAEALGFRSVSSTLVRHVEIEILKIRMNRTENNESIQSSILSPQEVLDEGSRALLMRMLDNATQQALLKQAKLLPGPLMSPALERRLSIQPGRRTGGEAEQALKPIASPSLSLHASEWSRRLKPQSPARSRDSRYVYDDRRGRDSDDRLLDRVASNRSSRTQMPRLHPSTPAEQRLAWLGSYRSSRVAEPRRDVGTGSASRAGRSDRHGRLRRGAGRGDRSSSSSSRAPSTTSRRVGSLDSRLSMGGVTSRCGSGRAARLGEATPRRGSSSSSNSEAVTINSRIRPNRELMERCVRRAEEIEELSLRRRGKKVGTVRSRVSMGLSSHRPRRALDRIDYGSTYSSGSSSSANDSVPSASTIHTAPSTLGASASPYSSSSVSVSPRGGTQPEHPFDEASSMSRSRRRRERQERREGRLRKFKNKVALVFHHRHDHHHHHHIGRGGRSGSPVSRHDRRGKNSKSPWSYLGGMFHHRTAGNDDGGKKKKSTSRTVVTAKRRGGGGGHAPSLFDALVKHKWGARKAPPARVVRTRSLSRVRVNKMHWWQRLSRQSGQAKRNSRPRRRLGQGKAL